MSAEAPTSASAAPTTTSSDPPTTWLRVHSSERYQGTTPATMPGASAKNATLPSAAASVRISAGSGPGALRRDRAPVSQEMLGEVRRAFVGNEQSCAGDFDDLAHARDRVAERVGPAHVERVIQHVIFSERCCSAKSPRRNRRRRVHVPPEDQAFTMTCQVTVTARLVFGATATPPTRA